MLVKIRSQNCYCTHFPKNIFFFWLEHGQTSLESPSSGSHQSRSSPTGFFWMPSCQCCRDDPVFLKPFIHHPHTVHSFGSTIPPSKDVPQFMDHLGTSGPVFQGRRKHSQDVMGECRNPAIFMTLSFLRFWLFTFYHAWSIPIPISVNYRSPLFLQNPKPCFCVIGVLFPYFPGQIYSSRYLLLLASISDPEPGWLLQLVSLLS